MDENTAGAVDRGDGSHGFYRVDLRSLAATCRSAEGTHPLMLGPLRRRKRKMIALTRRRFATACAVIFCRSATGPRRRFANGGARCGIATCWFGRSSAWRQKSCNHQYFFGMPIVFGCISHHFKCLQWRSPACGNQKDFLLEVLTTSGLLPILV